MTSRRVASIIVGWREFLSLPDLGVPRIKAKIDTGARTSVLHAENVRYVRKGGRRMVRFTVLPKQRTEAGAVDAIAPFIEERMVRSSNGESERRPVIQTTLRLRDDEWPIELTLTRRDVMGFRMLLGRQAVRRRFLIDPGSSFLGGRRSARSTGAP